MFLIVSSCTIQKKLHSNGYHIEWKSCFKEDFSKDISDKKVIIEEEISFNDTLLSKVEKDIENPENFYEEIEKETNKENVNKTHSKNQKQYKLVEKNSLQTNRKADSKKTYYYRNSNTATTYAFISHFGGLMIIVGVCFVLFSSFDPLLFVVVLILGGFGLLIISTIGGLIKLFQHNYGIFPMFASITIYTYSVILFLAVLISLLLNY